MNTGDQKYIDEFEDGTSKLGAYEDRDIATTMRGFFNNQNTKKSDKEIQEIAKPIWDNLVKTSNIKDYGGFTKDFSSQMLIGANEVELGKQWANNKILTSLSEKQEFLGCIRRAQFITVLYKQTSNTIPGEFLGRLVLGFEDGAVKVFGATIY